MQVALLWFINENGELLLAQRSHDTDTDPGVWGPSVSGGIDEGEDADYTLVRESFEELGIDVASYPREYMYSTSVDHPDGNGVRHLNVYYARIPSEMIEKIQPEPSEVAGVKWISIDELESLRETNRHEIINATIDDYWIESFDKLRSITVS